jgi:2-iminobutanoate/2-iminopropanoate deaminase
VAETVERIAGAGPWPLAVRAGQFLFLSGQLPVESATGRLIAGYADVPAEGRWLETGSLLVDAQEGPLAAQVWWLYHEIGATLERLGSSLDDVLLLNGWLADFRRWPTMNRVRERAFGPGRYPASSTFQVPDLGCPGALALFETLALAEGPLRKEPLGSSRQVGHYFPGSKVGPFLFLAGEVPADPERGLVVRGYTDLDAEGQRLATGQLGPDGWDGPIRAQAWAVYQRIRRLLEDHGSSLAHVVKQNVYLRDPRDYPAFEGISWRVFGDRLPPTTVVPVDEFGHRDFRLEVEVTAVVAGAVEPEWIASDRLSALGPGCPLAARAGSFVFVSGQLPVVPASRAILARAPDGGDRGALAAAQTALIYENLRVLLGGLGLGLETVVRQVIYVADPAVLPAVAAAAAAATGAAPPATTLVPVRPLWPEPALVLIDATAYAEGWSALQANPRIV